VEVKWTRFAARDSGSRFVSRSSRFAARDWRFAAGGGDSRLAACGGRL